MKTKSRLTVWSLNLYEENGLVHAMSVNNAANPKIKFFVAAEFFSGVKVWISA